MNWFQALTNENLISALGWTLIHSIWQIAIIGITLKVSLYLLRNRSAEIRHMVSLFSLAAILISVIITFIKFQLAGYGPVGQTTMAQVSSLPETIASLQNMTNGLKPDTDEFLQNFLLKASQFINAKLYFIVGIWFLGILILSLKLAGNLWIISNLKKQSSICYEKLLNDLMGTLVRKLKIRQGVSLFNSLEVKAPMVMGYLKPVIIIPAGLMASLPYDKVEAILIHELAHIRRKDYLVNILKSLIEIIFFYHPVIWWISETIETERENCCDDVTIRTCGNEASLRNALINLQHVQAGPENFAPALLNKKYKLLNRIMRMKTTNQFKHGMKEGLTGFAILFSGLFILATSSAFAPKLSDLPRDYWIEASSVSTDSQGFITKEPAPVVGIEESYSMSPAPKTNPVLSPDTVSKKNEQTPAGNEKITMEFDGNYNLVSVSIDGKPLEGDEKAEYEAMAERMKQMKEYQQQQTEHKAVLEKAEKELQSAQEQIEMARREYERAISAYHEDLIYSDDSLNTRVFVWTDKTSKHPGTAREIRIERLPELPDIPEVYAFSFPEDELEEVMKKNMKYVDYYLDIRDDQIKDIEELRDRIKIIEIEKQLEKDLGSKKLIIKAIDSEDMLPAIRKELVSDGILKNKGDKMDFRLTNDSLEVNGNRLSDDLHRKYLKMYQEFSGNKKSGKFEIRIKD